MALCSVSDDEPEDRAGEHDLPVVRLLATRYLQQTHAVREQESDGEAEGEAEGERVDLAGEDADQDARDESLDGRADDDADDQWGGFGGRDERGEAVEDAERAAEDEAVQCSFHALYSTNRAESFSARRSIARA